MYHPLILVALIAVPLFVLADQQPHSLCYNYFLQKDECVYGSLEKPCCDTHHPTKHTCNAGGFHHPDHPCPSEAQTSVAPPTPAKKMRRYDTTTDVFYVAGGTGTCGVYNTTTQPGLCIWNGPVSGDNSAATAGWLNGNLTQNCNKQVYVQRKNQTDTVQFVPILDSCTFNTDAPEVGCFQAYVTKALFDLFNPTAEELRLGKLLDLTWDFNNGPGTNHPENAPI